MLGKLPVPGRPAGLDKSRARAYCAYSRCGWVWFGHFSLIYHFSLLSPSFWETARYRLKYCLKEPLSPKQPTYQLTSVEGGRMVRRCWVNFQCLADVLILIKVGLGPAALAVGAGGDCLNTFLSSVISHFFLPLSGKQSDID